MDAAKTWVDIGECERPLKNFRDAKEPQAEATKEGNIQSPPCSRGAGSTKEDDGTFHLGHVPS